MLIVLTGWVVFRIVDLPSTMNYYGIMLGINKPDFVSFDFSWYLDRRTVVVLIVAIMCCIPWKSILEKRSARIKVFFGSRSFTILKRAVLIALFALSYMSITTDSYNPFIYFRF
jgi:alginate O-acetyltransferase complex protein AlgI